MFFFIALNFYLSFCLRGTKVRIFSLSEMIYVSFLTIQATIIPCKRLIPLLAKENKQVIILFCAYLIVSLQKINNSNKYATL